MDSGNLKEGCLRIAQIETIAISFEVAAGIGSELLRIRPVGPPVVQVFRTTGGSSSRLKLCVIFIYFHKAGCRSVLNGYAGQLSASVGEWKEESAAQIRAGLPGGNETTLFEFVENSINHT